MLRSRLTVLERSRPALIAIPLAPLGAVPVADHPLPSTIHLAPVLGVLPAVAAPFANARRWALTTTRQELGLDAHGTFYPLARRAAGWTSCDPAQLVANIESDLRAYVPGELADDMAMVAVRRKGAVRIAGYQVSTRWSQGDQTLLARITEVPDAFLVGRERELGLLAALLDGVSAGGGSLLIAGEPGMGRNSARP